MVRSINIASIPRCGSTMLCHCIEGTKIKSFWHGRSWPYNIDKNTKVVKTHTYKIQELQKVRSIFLFGDIKQSILSFINRRWDIRSLRNCHYNGSITDANIFNADILNLELIFDNWTNNKLYPTLCVKYEYLWDNIGIIEDYLSQKIILPIKKKRRKYSNDYDFSIYDSLIKKVKDAKSIW